MELDGHILLMHRYQGCLVGVPPRFGDLEIDSLILVTISNSYFSLHAFILMILACHVFFMFIILNAIFIRLVIYTYSL